jgi:hypothetical protein
MVKLPGMFSPGEAATSPDYSCCRADRGTTLPERRHALRDGKCQISNSRYAICHLRSEIPSASEDSLLQGRASIYRASYGFLEA